jgi:lysophospholipase L1-like esterase
MTHTIIISLATVGILGFVLFWFWLILKTVWLIAMVTPYIQTIENAPRVLVLGDSTGYGTGADKSTESVAGLLGRDFAVSIENNSVNGRTIGELKKAVSAVTDDYTLILLQIGGNDIIGERAVSEVEQELRSTVESLQEHTEHLVMISSGNVGAAPKYAGERATKYEALSRDYREMFLAVSASTFLTYVDLFEEPEVDPFVKEPKKYVAIDGLHPTSAGYALWYEKLFATLEEHLVTEKQ